MNRSWERNIDTPLWIQREVRKQHGSIRWIVRHMLDWYLEARPLCGIGLHYYGSLAEIDGKKHWLCIHCDHSRLAKMVNGVLR